MMAFVQISLLVFGEVVHPYEQMAGKYLVQDRVSKKVYESPQFLYMLVGMCLFSNYDKDTRLDFVTRRHNLKSHCPRPSCQACVPHRVSSARAS